MTLEELTNQEYIGDGVYIGQDNLGITWIITSNGMQTTNAICMELAVLLGLVNYLIQNKIVKVENRE